MWKLFKQLWNGSRSSRTQTRKWRDTAAQKIVNSLKQSSLFSLWLSRFHYSRTLPTIILCIYVSSFSTLNMKIQSYGQMWSYGHPLVPKHPDNQGFTVIIKSQIDLKFKTGTGFPNIYIYIYIYRILPYPVILWRLKNYSTNHYHEGFVIEFPKACVYAWYCATQHMQRD